jgi:hypothetical protein
MVIPRIYALHWWLVCYSNSAMSNAYPRTVMSNNRARGYDSSLGPTIGHRQLTCSSRTRFRNDEQHDFLELASSKVSDFSSTHPDAIRLNRSPHSRNLCLPTTFGGSLSLSRISTVRTRSSLEVASSSRFGKERIHFAVLH